MLTDIGLRNEAYTELEKMFQELDLNADGTISLSELAHVSTQIPGIGQDTFSNIIRTLDRNGNQNVDISEFIAALVMEQDEADEALVKSAFDKLDKKRRCSCYEKGIVLRAEAVLWHNSSRTC